MGCGSTPDTLFAHSKIAGRCRFTPQFFGISKQNGPKTHPNSKISGFETSKIVISSCYVHSSFENMMLRVMGLFWPIPICTRSNLCQFHLILLIQAQCLSTSSRCATASTSRTAGLDDRPGVYRNGVTVSTYNSQMVSNIELTAHWKTPGEIDSHQCFFFVTLESVIRELLWLARFPCVLPSFTEEKTLCCSCKKKGLNLWREILANLWKT